MMLYAPHLDRSLATLLFQTDEKTSYPIYFCRTVSKSELWNCPSL